MVIGRAVVNDLFDDRYRTKCFPINYYIGSRSDYRSYIGKPFVEILALAWHFQYDEPVGRLSILLVALFLPGKKQAVVSPVAPKPSFP